MNAEAPSARPERSLSLPPVLRAGFRPFFFLAAIWAVVVIALWIPALRGAIELPTAFDALAWHRHEMLFGFVGAAIAGFLLTAIPNWTGRLPIAGWRLAVLVLLWVAARGVILFSDFVGGVTAMLVEIGFLMMLAGASAREVLLARNRNLPMVGVVLLFSAAAMTDHLEGIGLISAKQLGWRGGTSLVIILISLIGGRIIPSFTRNWLMKAEYGGRLPGQPSTFDVIAIVATAAALFCWTFAIEPALTAAVLIAAGLLQLVRLLRWSGWRTAAEPLVLILHLAYAWIPIGLFLLGLNIIDIEVSGTAGLHALGAGAMGTMILAVMTRATLGHTGRDLHAGTGTVAIYSLVMIGAAIRVAVPRLPLDYSLLVTVAGTAWAGAFLLFTIIYGPKLLGPRPDGKP